MAYWIGFEACHKISLAILDAIRAHQYFVALFVPVKAIAFQHNQFIVFHLFIEVGSHR